jgi:hypothetical protein
MGVCAHRFWSDECANVTACTGRAPGEIPWSSCTDDGIGQGDAPSQTVAAAGVTLRACPRHGRRHRLFEFQTGPVDIVIADGFST